MAKKKKTVVLNEQLKVLEKVLSDPDYPIEKKVERSEKDRKVTISFEYDGVKYCYKKGNNINNGFDGELTYIVDNEKHTCKDEANQVYIKGTLAREGIHHDITPRTATEIVKKTPFVNIYKKKKRKKHVTKKTSKKKKGHVIKPQNPKVKAADFLVRSNIGKCVFSHQTQPINAIVRVSGNNELYDISVPAFYCGYCNKYYILERNYQELKKYGYICCRVIEEKQLTSNDLSDSYSKLKDKSLLKTYGYNVNQNDGLSDVERQKILTQIVSNNIMSKNEVVAFIEWLINRSKNIPSHKFAIEKWKRDVKFLNELVAPTKTVYVKSIAIKTRWQD